MAKLHPADVEANRLMDLQRELAPADRRRNIVLIIVCAVLILSLAVTIYCLPHRDFSEVENTALQTFPRVSSAGKFLDRIWDGRFMAELKDFYTDQFPLRDALVAAKAAGELALGKTENNDVILAEDGYLVKRIEYNAREIETLQANLEAVLAFGDAVDLPVTFALAPRAVDVLQRYLPSHCSVARGKAVWETVDAYTSAGGALISLRDSLAAAAEAGEDVWYRTDHHWTTLGAYYAYAELGEALGYVPAAREQFTVETAADDFRGTTYSASGFNWIPGEPMQFYRWAGDENCLLEIFAGEKVIDSFGGFYDRSYLEKKDKYSAFLSSNNAYMRITSGEDKPTLLLIKDSFAHSVVPFLGQHFNLEILDLRYYRGTTAAFLAEHEVDGVLILCGLDSLATSGLLTALPLGFDNVGGDAQ